MATPAGAIIGAAAARARREVRAHFEDAGAFNPNNAVAYDPPSYLHERQFKSLIGQGILKQTGTERFWIDREAVELEAQQRRGALKILLVVILAGLVIAGGIYLAFVRVG